MLMHRIIYQCNRQFTKKCVIKFITNFNETIRLLDSTYAFTGRSVLPFIVAFVEWLNFRDSSFVGKLFLEETIERPF